MTRTTLLCMSTRQKIGSQCQDGSISADGKSTFAMPEGAPLLLDFNGAAKYIADLNAIRLSQNSETFENFLLHYYCTL